jgi:DNA processing protein
LGSGLDIIYPWENRGLAHKISQNGALISEFPLQTRPLAKNFLERNRIISGLALAVLVIEGERKSGTLSTAAHAANQGREVFVLPGSPATEYLAQQGARICQNPVDILEYLSHESDYC